MEMEVPTLSWWISENCVLYKLCTLSCRAITFVNKIVVNMSQRLIFVCPHAGILRIYWLEPLLRPVKLCPSHVIYCGVAWRRAWAGKTFDHNDEMSVVGTIPLIKLATSTVLLKVLQYLMLQNDCISLIWWEFMYMPKKIIKCWFYSFCELDARSWVLYEWG